ncbi:MAG: orotidine 5'-phosphate decarboxylase / HUMPS family protein [archaeon]
MDDKPIVQVALDFVDFERAMKVAKICVDKGVDWIEVGTPLIKAEGLDAVRKFRRAFPKNTIVADMKTVDTGAVEVEIAAKAGADVVILLGVSDDSTIVDAVKEAERYGTKIMIDMLGVPKERVIERAVEIARMGVHYVVFHLSIDEQMKGQVIDERLALLRDAVNIPLAVAGGLDEDNVALACENGADILIIGSAITKQADVGVAIDRVFAAIAGASLKADRRAHREDEVFGILSKVSTPNISDAMHGLGAMKGIVALTPGRKMVGRAVTVRAMNGDWSKPVEAIDVAKVGDVIVIDANGGDVALWGELASHSAVNRGIAGVVIDGTIRDIDEIRGLEFSAFARYVRPNAGEAKGFGEIGVRVNCGEQVVNDGDYIVGDDNGVVVVPRKDAVEVANRAMSVFENENRIRGEIKKGGTLSGVLKLKKWEKLSRI